MARLEHTVTRDGVRLIVKDSGGDGDPIVLLHGLAGHAAEWNAIAKLLGSRFRVIALDQRGHGASERHPEDVSRAAYVADVAAVVDHLGLKKPVLLGQSLGGLTAILAAAEYPDMFSALIVVEAGPGGPYPDLQIEIGDWMDSWPLPFPDLDTAAAFLGEGLVGHAWASSLEKRDDGWWPRFDRDVMVRSLTENATRDFWDEWDRVQCPTFAVYGENGIIQPEEINAMQRRRPGTGAITLPDAGHDLHLEQPETLVALIEDFLAKLAKSRLAKAG
jgi:pimeloyl-ACP methyl ester carboxylesterase